MRLDDRLAHRDPGRINTRITPQIINAPHHARYITLNLTPGGQREKVSRPVWTDRSVHRGAEAGAEAEGQLRSLKIEGVALHALPLSTVINHGTFDVRDRMQPTALYVRPTQTSRKVPDRYWDRTEGGRSAAAGSAIGPRSGFWSPCERGCVSPN